MKGGLAAGCRRWVLSLALGLLVVIAVVPRAHADVMPVDVAQIVAESTAAVDLATGGAAVPPVQPVSTPVAATAPAAAAPASDMSSTGGAAAVDAPTGGTPTGGTPALGGADDSARVAISAGEAPSAVTAAPTAAATPSSSPPAAQPEPLATQSADPEPAAPAPSHGTLQTAPQNVAVQVFVDSPGATASAIQENAAIGQDGAPWNTGAASAVEQILPGNLSIQVFVRSPDASGAVTQSNVAAGIAPPPAIPEVRATSPPVYVPLLPEVPGVDLKWVWNWNWSVPCAQPGEMAPRSVTLDWNWSWSCSPIPSPAVTGSDVPAAASSPAPVESPAPAPAPAPAPVALAPSQRASASNGGAPAFAAVVSRKRPRFTRVAPGWPRTARATSTVALPAVVSERAANKSRGAGRPASRAPVPQPPASPSSISAAAAVPPGGAGGSSLVFILLAIVLLAGPVGLFRGVARPRHRAPGGEQRPPERPG